MLDIIILLALAIFFISRLRNVLGKHIDDSQIKRPRGPASNGPASNVYPLNPEEVQAVEQEKNNADAMMLEEMGNPDVTSGLMAIKAADPHFHVKEFIGGAKMAFEMIVDAFNRGDTAQLKPLLSKEVMDDFAQAINDRKASEIQEETTLVSIESCEIVDAELNGKTAEITVQFVSEQITLERDATGNIISGNASDPVSVTDEWTFARAVNSPNPNWLLVAS